jgi:hypothetical protein
MQADHTTTASDPTSTPDVPFDRSYWVEPGRLLAGYYPGSENEETAAAKLRNLLDAGTRCLVNLVEENEVSYKTGRPLRWYHPLATQLAAEQHLEVACLRIAIRDQHVPSSATMKRILDAIDGALQKEQPTYVHCWGGHGRTGTVVGCYLARHGIATGEEALARVEFLRRFEATAYVRSPDTEAQREMIRRWEPGH